MIKSAKAALAVFFGCDISDLTENNYQPGRHTKTVYTMGDDYYCAAKTSKGLPQPLDKSLDRFEWIECEDGPINRQGWKIFKSKMKSE